MTNDGLAQKDEGNGVPPGGRRNSVGSGGSDDGLTREGIVSESLPSYVFRVNLDDGRQILAGISGKLRKNFFVVQLGDRVLMKLKSYDSSRGRITDVIR
jgi:translation initiation factor IF-1